MERSQQNDGESNALSSYSFNADELLAHGAKQIISLFVPVTICMFFVVTVAKTVDYYGHTDHYLLYTPFHTPDADLGTRTWQALANTLIFMAVIVVVTCILVLLFKFRCYKVIRGWLILTTFFMLFLITFIFFTQMIRTLGIFIDYITVAFVVWNVGAVGLIAIHWRAPLVLQQTYLIFMSAQIALIFLKYLPKWTCWVILGALAIWDLIAVLCPRGPLRILVEMAHERQEPLFPAMIYSTTANYVLLMLEPKNSVSGQESAQSYSPQPTGAVPSTGVVSNTSHEMLLCENGSSDTNAPNDSQTGLQNQPEAQVSSGGQSSSAGSDAETTDLRSRRPETTPSRADSPAVAATGNSENTTRWLDVQANLRARNEHGVKLGLGDFVFYSVLIGRAALDGDAVTIATCYVAILVGMCVTIIVLGITMRALPALPISIASGILFYFTTSVVISPFLQTFTTVRLLF